MERDVSALFQGVLSDFGDLRDVGRLAQAAVRLLIAALLGGLLGYEREAAGKHAGLRTYMLVTVSSAFFVLLPQLEGFNDGDISRVLQGIITGIGFIGGGTILKLTGEKEVQGLTTAASIWFAAALGIAVGFGRLGTAIVGALFAFIILSVLCRAEANIPKRHNTG